MPELENLVAKFVLIKAIALQILSGRNFYDLHGDTKCSVCRSEGNQFSNACVITYNLRIRIFCYQLITTPNGE